jgi:hypothetical protein
VPYKIDEALKGFVESGVGVLVGTGDDTGKPCATYGWAPRVAPDGVTLEVFVDSLRAGQTLANLRANGRIAVTIGHPVSYRSVQFKGTIRDHGQPDERDNAWVAKQREEFVVSTALVGDPPATIRNLWLDDVVRISFTVEKAFDQTPGPEAGKPL